MTRPEPRGGAAPPVASRVGAGDRLHAVLAGFGRAPGAVVTSPEPLWTGDGAAARRLASGVLMFAGSLAEAPGASPWTIPAPTADWSDTLHGHVWLDDFAAAGEGEARARLRDWLFDWIARFGGGRGPGWRADLTGRRLTRWICHAPAILSGAGPDRSRAFFAALGRQIRFLRRRWRTAPEGLPRIEAAAGLIYAGLALEGAEGAPLAAGIAALGREAERRVGRDGGVPSRSPEEAAAVFATLLWAARSLREAGRAPAPEHEAALPRLAAAVRALRLGDGRLARFHGGGGGDPERIDAALAASGARPAASVRETMGFHRLASGRTVLVFDGSAEGAARTAHASLFCFEMSVGRRPMIVNCGPGARFGETWRKAARATAAHSGLAVEEISSARLAGGGRLVQPAHVSALREEDETGVWLIAEHDGWLASHGLLHHRRLWLSADGGDLRGEDRVSAEGPGPRAIFDMAAGRENRMEAPFSIRFHLHPEVEAEPFLAGSALRLRAGGETWVMRQSGGRLSMEESVWLDEARARPRATKQIVVRAAAKDYRGAVKWTFRRAEAERPSAREAAESEA